MGMEKQVKSSQEGFGRGFKPRSLLLSGNEAKPCCGQTVCSVFKLGPGLLPHVHLD